MWHGGLILFPIDFLCMDLALSNEDKCNKGIDIPSLLVFVIIVVLYVFVFVPLFFLFLVEGGVDSYVYLPELQLVAINQKLLTCARLGLKFLKIKAKDFRPRYQVIQEGNFFFSLKKSIFWISQFLIFMD